MPVSLYQAFEFNRCGGEPPMYFVQTVFDEGVTLLGPVLVETTVLLQEVYQAV
jgi:hypothetical protein